MNTIRLSFDDTKRVESRKKEVTKVTIYAYVSFDTINNFDNEFCDVINALEKQGFNVGGKGYFRYFSGKVTLQEGDTEDQAAAYRIAGVKAKVKAYGAMKRVMDDLAKKYGETTCNFMANTLRYDKLETAEKQSLDRCIKTGYCDPKKSEQN